MAKREKELEITDRLKGVPHLDLIQKNSTVVIPSVFMFKDGGTELFSFLFACQELNCTVYFKNEEITVTPEKDVYQDMLLSIYAMIAQSPKIANDYISYLTFINDMTWDKISYSDK